MVQMTTKQNFSILHDPLKPHNYPSDWNKQHDALFGQYMCGIEKTCGIDQLGGQYRTREYFFSFGPHATTAGSAGCLL